MTALPFSDSLHDYPRPARRHHMVLGVGVLLLHGAFLYGWRHAKPPPLPDSGPKVESITVWIRPPAVKPLPPPLARVAPRREQKPLRAATTPRAAAPAAKPVPNAITVAPSPTPADPPAADAPKFDMEAALGTARKVASERDPAKAGTAVGQIPDQPLRTQTRLARDIASGKRGDCRTDYAGAGLLAPVLMLLDKKDSGCKW
ncbi:hypothetical protein [Janthinobacterium sp. PC23-8]|uniref:hypothetical protein n=1 Tax=Janthinobacterium sp. PC23-8 TaxID=2012679 RepID=UPI000B966FCD|nr:hypothetical protein [Janthinobacterium sp. PC23-8]OYO31465.1 hypothetical protein CD932_10295 [Janthinobacterium sp. PC23-8]